MISHVGVGDPDVFPVTSLCGKRKTRKSLIHLPLACVRCLRILIEEANR